MEKVAELIQPLSVAIDEKLGRCASCMRLSAALTVGTALILFAFISAGAGTPLIVAAAVAAAASTTLSIAHGIAFLVRPAPAQGCLSCAEKAKARMKARRRQRMWSWLWKRKTASATRKGAECTTCGKPRPLETLVDIADELPSADEDLRSLVEASPEFQSLMPQLAAPEPSDTWRANMRSNFVYTLKPAAYGEGAAVLFVASWDSDGLLSATVVIPDKDGGEPRAIDLRTGQEGQRTQGTGQA